MEYFSQLYDYQDIKVMHKYPTNLTDKQWQVIKNMLDPKERFRKYSLRSVFDGILYIVKTGVQWRMLPSDFAPWQTVYYYFSKWKNEGLLEEIFDTLRGIVRRLSGRKEHIVVDTLGLPMSVRVHPANVHDSVGAEEGSNP